MTLPAPALLTIAGLWFLAVATPGPNFLMTTRLAVAETRAAGIFAVLGIGVGTTCWAMAGFFGLQALFAAAPWAFLGMKLLGGAYLVVLGVRLWRNDPAADPKGPALSRTPGSASRLGLVTNLSNPKSALLVASVFAATLPPTPPVALAPVIAAEMAGISMLWYAALVCLVTTRPVRAAFGQGRRWIDRIAGTIFVLFGARLIVSR